MWDTIFGGIPEEESKTVSPICIVQESDLDGSDNEVADRLLINANDVQALRDYFKDATTVSGKDDEKKQVVLFRFATTDYYSAAVDIMELRTIIPDKHISGQAYRAFLISFSSPLTGTAYIRSFPWCPALWISSTR